MSAPPPPRFDGPPPFDGDVPVTEPSWRKPAGAFLLLALMTFWVVLIASLPVQRLPGWAQAIAFAVAGLVWIWLFPFRRLFTWMETGRWR